MRYIIILSFIITSLFADIPEGYYDSANGLSGEVLKAALHDIINDHIEFPYTSTSTDTWDILKETDRDPDNPDNVILFYTGWSVDAQQEYNNGSGWSREHVWAKSHGDFGTSMGAGTDVHNLRPCDISVNSSKGNKDFDNGGEEYIDPDGGPTGCYRTTYTWEPREAVKGDVARMIFYMATRYEGDNGEVDLEVVDYAPSSPNGEPVHGIFSTLMEWHAEDPVDEFEENRNDIIYEDYQENRNPFIDHPEYVELIYNPVFSENNQMSPKQYSISNYPNPFNPTTTIN
jgi:endonuclease I